MEYDVLWDTNIHGLIEMVNKAILNGWVPSGTFCSTDAAFYQVVTRLVDRG